MFKKSPVKVFTFFYAIVTTVLCLKLKSCNDSVNFTQLCSLTETYTPGFNDFRDTGILTNIQTIVSMFQLADIDVIKDTVTVNMIFSAIWNDTRLSINQPSNEK